MSNKALTILRLLTIAEPLNSLPEDEHAYHIRGQVYTRIGQFDLAIADCTKSIEINSEDVHAYRVRGAAYFHNDEYQLAIGDYSKIIEFSPKHEFIYLLRADTYLHNGDYDLALADLRDIYPGKSQPFAHILHSRHGVCGERRVRPCN